MLRKRKLTASFLEIPEEKDTLQRSWRSGEHSDWTLALGDQVFKVHKVIVATGERASAFLAAAFRKHLGESDERTDLTSLIPKHCWPYFEAVLDFIYTDTVDLKVESWGPLVKMADVLQMGSLYTKCVEAGNEFLSVESAGESAAKDAPRLAMDTVGLQLGGELQQQVIQIASDTMSSYFKSYSVDTLAALPVSVLQSMFIRDDLEVDNEDAVFDVLLSISSKLEDPKADMELLWRCCRLNRLSPSRVLDIAVINEIPKQALVWALANGMQPPGDAPLTAPTWANRWAASSMPRGREITFLVPNAGAYAKGKFVRSEIRRLMDRFSWRLLVFPNGTEATAGKPGATGAFVELVPDEGVENWTVQKVQYSISILNWKDENKVVTKEHTFQFTHTEVDNGWHRGWLTADMMNCEQGWISERGEMRFRAVLGCRNAEVHIHKDNSHTQTDNSRTTTRSKGGAAS